MLDSTVNQSHILSFSFSLSLLREKRRKKRKSKPLEEKEFIYLILSLSLSSSLSLSFFRSISKRCPNSDIFSTVNPITFLFYAHSSFNGTERKREERERKKERNGIIISVRKWAHSIPEDFLAFSSVLVSWWSFCVVYFLPSVKF